MTEEENDREKAKAEFWLNVVLLIWLGILGWFFM